MTSLYKFCLNNVLVANVKLNQVRNFARWSHRRPVKVIPPEEYENLEKQQEEKLNEQFKEDIKIKWRYKNEVAAEEVMSADVIDIENRKFKPKKRDIKPQITKVTDMLETVINDEGDFVYTKMKNNDSRIGMLMATIKSRKEKTKKDLVLLEGKRLIRDALLSGCKLKYLLFTRKDEIEYLKPNLPKLGAQLYKMPYKEMQMWSDLTTTPGIMGIFRVPEVDTYVSKNPIPLTIICDNIRDPGNLGSILRTAAGLGCAKVILTKGCVNLWDTKVTRSAAGSHFRLNILTKIDFSEIKSNINENANVFIADNNIISGTDGEIQMHNSTLSYIQNMPILPYYSIQFNKNYENILIIGGETNGISMNSYKLAKEFNGVRLNIPLNNGIESLNSGTALGIIGFEICRQFNTKKPIVVDKNADNEMDVSLSLKYL